MYHIFLKPTKGVVTPPVNLKMEPPDTPNWYHSIARVTCFHVYQNEYQNSKYDLTVTSKSWPIFRPKCSLKSYKYQTFTRCLAYREGNNNSNIFCEF